MAAVRVITFFFIACIASTLVLGQVQDQNQINHAYPEQLTPDEVKTRLGQLVDEFIDKDKDGYLTVEELKEWIKGVQDRISEETTNHQWAYYDPPSAEQHSWNGYQPQTKQLLLWEIYKNMTYPDHILKDAAPGPDGLTPKDLLLRAERRFKMADTDGDGALSKDEFKSFIQPEDSNHMKNVLVIEAIEDMDRDKNGDVSLQEFMEHMKRVSGPEQNDPQWVQAQQNQFQNFLDKNKDGTLNNEEMTEWIIPPYDRSEGEAWRLMSIADHDRDSKISKQDILNNFELFMVLQTPDFWTKQPSDAKRDEL